MNCLLVIVIIAFLNDLTNAESIGAAQRNGPQARQKKPHRAQANNQFLLQKSQPGSGANPNPVIFPAPASLGPYSNGAAPQVFPPSFFIPGSNNYAGQNIQQPLVQSAAGPVPLVQRPYSFPGDPCSPQGGRPSCVASSICSARGACECPNGFAKSKFFCMEQPPQQPQPQPQPLPPPPPVFPPNAVPPLGPIPQFQVPFDGQFQVPATVPVVPRYFQIPPPQPPPAPMPISFELPGYQSPPSGVRWALIGIIPVRERPDFQAPIQAPFAQAIQWLPAAGPVGVREPFKSVAPSTVPALAPLVPFPPLQRPFAPAEFYSQIPAPAPVPVQAPWSFAPWNGPAAPAPGPAAFNYGPGPLPAPAPGFVENASPFSPFSPNIGPLNPIPFFTNPGPSFAQQASGQFASPLDGADDKKARTAGEYSSFGADSAVNPETPALVQHAPPMTDSIAANDQSNYESGLDSKKDKAR